MTDNRCTASSGFGGEFADDREPTVVVHRGDPVLAALAARGIRLGPGWSIVDVTPPGALRLAEGPFGAELLAAGEAPGRGVRCDWDWLKTALRAGSLRRQPLAKAIGDAKTVVDATAGLGDDAMTLAALGCRVLAFERHPVIWALLDDALLRARDDATLREIAARIELRQADAVTALEDAMETDGDRPNGGGSVGLASGLGGGLGGEPARRPDAILLDPMFPPRRRRSALPRKGMQVLRRVVGADLDADALLDAALAVAIDRVIVKRLDDGPPMREPVDFTIRARTMRCDVYRPRRDRKASA